MSFVDTKMVPGNVLSRKVTGRLQAAVPRVRPSLWLAPELFDLTRSKNRKRLEKLGVQGQEIAEAVRSRTQNNHAEGAPRDVLLLWELLIDRDQRIEAACHDIEQIAVVQSPHRIS